MTSRRGFVFKMVTVNAVHFIYSFCLAAFWVCMPLYVKKLFSGEGIWANLNVLFTFSAAALGLVAGLLGDRIGKKRTCIAGLGLFALLMLGYAEAQRVRWFVVFFVFNGLAMGLYLSNITALIQEFSEKKRGLVNSLFFGIGSLGGIAGPFVSGRIVVSYGYTAFWTFASTLLAVGAGVLLLLKDRFRPMPLVTFGEELRNTLGTYRLVLSNKDYRYMLVGGGFFQAFGAYVISLYFALYLKQVGASIVRIGDVFSTGQTVYFAAALLCGLISDRLSKKALFVLGLTVVGIGVIAIGLSRAVLLILFCYLVREMGRAFIHSMQWPVIAYILPPDVRATANALYLTVIYMGCMMTSLITGFTISMFPLWHVFMLGGLMSIAGGIVVYFNIESTEREIHAQAQPTRY